MRVFSLVTVLSTLVSLHYVAAEPIPTYAKGEVLKRVAAEPFGKHGNGVHFWAWSRIPYDPDWNSEFKVRKLKHEKYTHRGEEVDRDWVRLAAADIQIQGIDGGPVTVNDDGKTYDMHMHAIVGKDFKKKDIVVAFEGTDDTAKLFADLRTSPSEVKGVSGRIHQGFGQCFTSVLAGVTEALSKLRAEPDWANYDLVFTGHSLGGAVALIAANYFLAKWSEVRDDTYVFTYGAPRAGNLEFQQSLQEVVRQRMFNFRHQSDPVTISPFISWGYANPAARFEFQPDSTSDSWLDEKKWQQTPGADEETRPLGESVMQIADTLWQKLQTHTGYFQDDKVVTKRESSQPRSFEMNQKRAPIPVDLSKADDAITDLIWNGDLADPPSSPPDTIYDLTESLDMKGQELKLWSSVLDKSSEVEREGFITLVRAVAEECASAPESAQ